MNIKLLTVAVKNLLPDNTPFNVIGATYAGIDILNETELPSEDAVMDEYARVEAAEPMRILREERDRLIAETDWWVLPDRTASEAQLAYRQALRNLPDNSTPVLDNTTMLGISGVTWPTKPS
jgi:hypothetical protein